jgi:nicotinate (nicotinamide) nucleotide adenylyltransferase
LKLGILGGTFNPPHVGHLVCAQEAHAQLDLDRVVLMPAGIPPHKDVADDPGAEARLALCERAIDGDERLAVSRLELDRPGRSYTVDTLRALRESSPQDDLTFIVGGDMARSLPSWREPAAVLELASVAVAERAGAEREQIRERLRELEPAAIAGYAADKKAIEIVELDLRGILGYADYFVICSGNTDRQVKAIHDGIHASMKKDHGLLPRRVEGLPQAHWVLMDYLDVVVHVFTPETRAFYRLEQLWGEAPARAIEAEPSVG